MADYSSSATHKACGMRWMCRASLGDVPRGNMHPHVQPPQSGDPHRKRWKEGWNHKRHHSAIQQDKTRKEEDVSRCCTQTLKRIDPSRAVPDRASCPSLAATARDEDGGVHGGAERPPRLLEPVQQVSVRMTMSQALS